jgi:hypothetical protein
MVTVNISAQNDADFYCWFAFQDASGNGIDIAGAIMDMKLRRQLEDATVYLELSTANGDIDIVDPSSGIFTILIEMETLQSMPSGDFVHSLVMTLNGLRTQIWRGTFSNNLGPSR